MYNNVLNELKKDEDFVAHPYNDSLGIPTIGYGTKLPIDEIEAELLLEKRFNDTLMEVKKNIYFFEDLSECAKEVILNMAYNLGVPRLLKFKRMLKALEVKDYRTAAKEMVDSLWYRQVGSRATRLVVKMSKCNN
jgi:lysozyme